MSDLYTSLLLILGSLFIFIGSIGVIRFPSALMRAHALSKAMLLGISLILLALIPSLHTFAQVAKVIFAIAFLIITIPIAGHIFALYASSKRK